jgi:hypothetical protein
MCRNSALRFARYLRKLGIACRVIKHRAPSGKLFFRVQRL